MLPPKLQVEEDLGISLTKNVKIVGTNKAGREKELKGVRAACAAPLRLSWRRAWPGGAVLRDCAGTPRKPALSYSAAAGVQPAAAPHLAAQTHTHTLLEERSRPPACPLPRCLLPAEGAGQGRGLPRGHCRRVPRRPRPVRWGWKRF